MRQEWVLLVEGFERARRPPGAGAAFGVEGGVDSRHEG
jgi:hypothetical protein